MSTGEAGPVLASRQNASSSTRTTLDRVYELREIILAQGIQRTNDFLEKWVGANGQIPDLKYGKMKAIDFWKIPNNQNSIMDAVPLTTVKRDGSTCYEYRSEKQRVLFRLRVVQTKHEFKQWLETPGVHVIYTGHSRYGRGACFGPDPAPGDAWGDGTGCLTSGGLGEDDGLLRLGYPIVGIPIHDIQHHGYHAVSVQDRPTIDRDTCHPEVVRMVPIRRMRIDPTLDPAEIQRDSFEGTRQDWGCWKWDGENDMIRIRPNSSFDLRELIYGADPDGDLWGYRKKDRKANKYKLHILLSVGWHDTIVQPWDLGSVNLRCKVFCHLGCSSLLHFQPNIRKTDRKNWRRHGEGRAKTNFAYFTSATSKTGTASIWLKWLLLYPRRNDFLSWEESLEETRKQTNKELSAVLGWNYKVI